MKYRANIAERSCLVMGALLALVWSIAARAHQANAPVIRRTTRVVNLNVVVNDSRHGPVRGLKQSDFTILDAGKPQTIAFFSAMDNEKPLAGPPVRESDTYSNRVEEHGADPSATVLLFDTLNSQWSSQGYGLHRVREFLRQIPADEHLGIYVLS